MLSVLRDANADAKRRDAMAIAAASYLHPKLSALEPKPQKRSAAFRRLSDAAAIRCEAAHTRTIQLSSNNWIG
jgi:hypothetical protein